MPPSDPRKFSVVVACGPSPRDYAGIVTLLDQLDFFEGGNLVDFVLVDDSRGAQDWAGLKKRFPVLKVVVSPRNGRGDAWRGGIATSVMAGLKAAFASPEPEFVLKMDTDTLVIGPFSGQLGGVFDTNSGAGIAGSCYAVDPKGEPMPPSPWKLNLVKHDMLFRLRRNPFPHVETALFHPRKTVRALLKKAIRNGWAWGACAQGGGYAVHRRLYTSWREQGFVADDLLWLHTDLGEDIITSLLCHAAGFSITDHNQRDEVFGVQYIGLPFPPNELLERNHAIIHSLKTADPQQELANREQLVAGSRAKARALLRTSA